MASTRPRSDLRTGLRYAYPRLLLIGAALVLSDVAVGQEIEQAPILYSKSTPKNVVTELQTRIAEGKTKLQFEPGYGYLRSLLHELNVPISSQVLVFSKTSLQRDRISPRTPRAVYFNDDVMIGFCRRGKVLEISVVDEVLGTAFYTLEKDQEEAEVQDEITEETARTNAIVTPRRQTESCLTCHASSANRGYPGHLVRSLFVDNQGEPLFARGSFQTDHESPLAERWGGWYVTGTSGEQKHMGNTITQEADSDGPDYSGTNVVDLKGRFPLTAYLSPHSDIVALMVLEHQSGMLNRLARANLETRMALHYQHEMNKALGLPADEKSDSAWSRIRNVGDSVVRYMLFQGETQLTGRVQGTSSFTTEFAARGPRDGQGRSLRDFDLTNRLFRHPCSYLIGSHAFDSLPNEVKDYVYSRLWEILNGRGGKDDPQLDSEDCKTIIAILRETKPNLPNYWKASTN